MIQNTHVKELILIQRFWGISKKNDPLLDSKFLNKLQKTRRGKTESKTIQLFE